jgi:hypothetical protein
MDIRLFRTNWRAALVILATLIAAATLAFAAPQAAHAGQYCIPSKTGACAPQKVEQRLAAVDYTGWTYLNLNYCAPGSACTQAFAVSTAAWKWTGKAWQHSSIKGGWVYVAPYSALFRWAYTPESGWVAIAGSRFEIR